jgi:DsbC/DsbD-like thiol-disulfide interchange protein
MTLRTMTLGVRATHLMLRAIGSASAAFAFCFSATTSSLAQDASNWDAQSHSASRLISGAMSKSHDTSHDTSHDATFLRAGIEIRLDPGWTTYWRDPGDSGAPPRFDFSGSENVKSVSVLWPAPERFPDGAGGNAIGYRNHVILPLHVIPADNVKPSALHLRLDYDVCYNICIPVEADLALKLNGDGAEDAAIEKAEVRVPRLVALARQPHLDQSASAQSAAGETANRRGDALAILDVRRQPGDAHERVIVDVAAPAGAPVELFVEGPTPDWSLPLPQQSAADGTIRHFEFELEGLPPDAKVEGAALTFTAVSGDDAIEVTAHLD